MEKRLKRSLLTMFVAFMFVLLLPGMAKADPVEKADTLGEQISREASGAANRGKCFITDIRVEAGQVRVIYQTDRAADLIVAFTEESTGKQVKSVHQRVSDQENIANMKLQGTLPSYFVATAYLADPVDHSPLCEEYVSSLYTKQMQELISADISDFNSERTVNFDSSSTTNFAVYGQNTIVIKETATQNKFSRTENGNYIIESAAGKSLTLKQGDKVAVETLSDGIVLFVCRSVNVSGTTVTVQSNEEADLTDIFDCIKIDSECQQSGMVVDTTGMDPLLQFEGIRDVKNASGIQASALDAELEVKKEASFKITGDGLEGKDDQPEQSGFQGGVTGNLTFGLSGKLSVYISHSYKYVSVIVEGEASADLTFEGKFTHEFKFGSFTLPTKVPGIYISVTPTVPIEASGQIKWSGSLKMTIGAEWNSDTGFENKCTWPQLSTKLEAEAKISFGCMPKVHVVVLKDELISVGIDPKFFAEAVGKLSSEKDDDINHSFCYTCIDGDINIGCDISLAANVGDKEYKKQIPELSAKIKVKDFYYSINRNGTEFGWGVCPHIAYVTKIQVKDPQGNPVKDARIKGTGLSYDPKTNDNGIAICALPNGTYALTATNGTTSGRTDLKIEDKPRTITINLKDGFDITRVMQLYGDAKEMADGTICLTKCETWKSGSAWYPEGIDTSKGFSVSFRYRAGGGRADSWGGADGIVMDFASKMGLGGAGQYIGFVDGYGIEMDSYPGNDNDPSKKHFAIVKDTTTNHIVSREDDRVDDGSWHTMQVIFDPDQQTLSVLLDGASILSASNVNMPQTVYMGLTAATGSGLNYHYVDDFSIKLGTHQISVFGVDGIYPSSVTRITPGSSIASVYMGEEKTQDDVVAVSFEGLDPGESYLLADTVDTGEEDFWNADNLLYISQGVADEEGKLQFAFAKDSAVFSSIRLYGKNTYEEDDSELVQRLAQNRFLAGYTYFSWEDGCKACDLVLTDGGDFVFTYPAKVTSRVLIPATCKSMGTTRYTASYEGLSESRDFQDIPQLNHIFSDWKITKRATALTKGSACRTCTLCGEKEEKKLDKLKATLKLSKKKVKLKRKKSLKIKVSGLAYGDSVKSWKSNKPKIVSVNNKGKLKAKKAGKAVITVTLKSGKKARIKVTVK